MTADHKPALDDAKTKKPPCHPTDFILWQLGHLTEDPPLSVPFSRRVWLYRELFFFTILQVTDWSHIQEVPTLISFVLLIKKPRLPEAHPSAIRLSSLCEAPHHFVSPCYEDLGFSRKLLSQRLQPKVIPT
jgi:hypothetical protein